MSTITLLPSQQDLIAYIAASMSDCGHDFSRQCVIFPAKRPGYFLRNLLAQKLQSAYLPPQIYSLDTFVDHLLREELNDRRTPIDPMDATALLFEIHQAAAERIGGEHFLSLERFIPIGLTLFAELEELKMAGVSGSGIRSVLVRTPYSATQTLPYYYESFYDRIATQGLTTRACTYDTLVGRINEINFSRYQSIIVAGFYTFTAHEAKLIQSLSALQQTMVLVQNGPGIQRRLESLGFEVTGDDVYEEQIPHVTLYQAVDTHGQVFALSHQLRELLESGMTPDESTVIVLPAADALFPVLHEPLALLEENQYNVALGYPLERTPLFGFLSALLDVVLSIDRGKVKAASYIAFVLHPYTKNIRYGTRSDITRVLFHAIEGHLAGKLSTPYLSLDEIENLAEVFDRVCHAFPADELTILPTDLKKHLAAIHAKTIRPLLQTGSIGEFARSLTGIVQYINDESTAHLHPLFHRYAESFLSLCTAMEASLLREKNFESQHGYAQFLRHAVAFREVPFAGTPVRGLQVLGLPETRGLRFDRVLMLDVCDDILPGTHRHHLLLPQPLREALGLETHTRREQQTEYYFSLLLNNAREVHLFYTEDGRHEKSRFIEKILWRQAQYQKNPEHLQQIHTIRYRLNLSTSTPAPLQKTGQVVRHLKHMLYSATALDTYLRCQLQFYYRYVLRLKEKDEVASEIEIRELGTLIHTLLKEFFTPTIGRTLLESDCSPERFEPLFESLFSATYGMDPFGSVLLMKQRLHDQLLQFICRYQRPMAQHHRIVITGLEQTLLASRYGYNFTGRVDRLEERDGGLIIFDYKIRHNDDPYQIRFDKLDPVERTTWAEAIGSLQLPLYALLYAEATGTPIDAVRPGYLLLGKKRLDQTTEAFLTDDPLEQQERLELLGGILHSLLDEITSEEHQFFPTDDFQNHCAHCPYAVLCGTQWTQAREY